MAVCVIAALYNDAGKLLETEMKQLTIVGQDSSGTLSLKPVGVKCYRFPFESNRVCTAVRKNFTLIFGVF